MENHAVVLSCIDGSSFSEAVCDYSAWIASTIQAPIKFLHTIEQSCVPEIADLTGAIGLGASEELLKELSNVEQTRRKLLIQKGKLMLEGSQAKAQSAGLTDIELSQQHGSLPEALIELESESRILVLGIRGQDHDNNNQQQIGATLETVVRSLHKPIFVVNTDFKKPEKIMLAYNKSPAAKKALAMICSSLLFKGIECHIVHVGNKHAELDTLLHQAYEQLKASGIEPKIEYLDGQIHEALANYQQANDIDLTVMGAFSHNRVRDFLLGSFTAKMLETTQKPLLLLR